MKFARGQRNILLDSAEVGLLLRERDSSIRLCTNYELDGLRRTVVMAGYYSKYDGSSIVIFSTSLAGVVHSNLDAVCDLNQQNAGDHVVDG